LKVHLLGRACLFLNPAFWFHKKKGQLLCISLIQRFKCSTHKIPKVSHYSRSSCVHLADRNHQATADVPVGIRKGSHAWCALFVLHLCRF
jgi:hypothetical protein